MSHLTRFMAIQIKGANLPAPDLEHRFMATRKFRFDFAWPKRKVALEIEGGTWTHGAHVRGAHYESDCIKYSEAAIMGWKVIRATSNMVNDGRALELLERAIAASAQITD